MTPWPPPPRLGRSFFKAHGLGNDYLVFEEGDAWTATPEHVARVCDRHRGAGGDGIVVLLADGARPCLRMFNPDGGEFERSGNGLRILATFLASRGRVGSEPFEVEVGGDVVGMTVHGSEAGSYDVSCAMGKARVGPEAIGLDASALGSDGRMAGPGGERLLVVPVSIGNPHLVVMADAITNARLASLGPFLATHPQLTNGTNVQIAAVESADRMRALIWERGVGATSASGTSACAVAVAGVTTGIVGLGELVVSMPGGSLLVHVTRDLDIVLRGPVETVMTGEIDLALVGGP